MLKRSFGQGVYSVCLYIYIYLEVVVQDFQASSAMAWSGIITWYCKLSLESTYNTSNFGIMDFE